MPNMSETELRAVCAAEIRNCIGLPGGLLSNWRRDAMKTYLGEPYGDEVDGRSKVVLRDVLETVEWVMPSLMRIFFAGGELVRYQPNRPDGEDGAAQATDYVNYVLRAKNQIFLALHDWFKDALILRVGKAKQTGSPTATN